MYLELYIDNQDDAATLRHILSCEVHRAELIERLLELLDRARVIAPPASVMMRVGEVGDDDD